VTTRGSRNVVGKEKGKEAGGWVLVYIPSFFGCARQPHSSIPSQLSAHASATRFLCIHLLRGIPRAKRILIMLLPSSNNDPSSRDRSISNYTELLWLLRDARYGDNLQSPWIGAHHPFPCRVVLYDSISENAKTATTKKPCRMVIELSLGTPYW